MKYYYRESVDPIQIRLQEDQVYKFELDCGQWAEDNGTITSTTAAVRSGSVTIGTPSVSSNAVTMSISQTSEGASRIELKVLNATYTGVQNILVRYVDSYNDTLEDYGN